MLMVLTLTARTIIKLKCHCNEEEIRKEEGQQKIATYRNSNVTKIGVKLVKNTIRHDKLLFLAIASIPLVKSHVTNVAKNRPTGADVYSRAP